MFFKNSFILGRSKWFAAWFHYILIALKLTYNSKKLFKTLHYWSRDMLNFDILDKGLGIVSTGHFVYDFSTKMFLMLYSINWINFIVCLFLPHEILDNMCIAIVLWHHKFQNSPDLSNQAVFIHDKKSKQKLKYLENEKSKIGEIKKHFSSFLKGFQLPKIVSDFTLRL